MAIDSYLLTVFCGRGEKKIASTFYSRTYTNIHKLIVKV